MMSHFTLQNALLIANPFSGTLDEGRLHSFREELRRLNINSHLLLPSNLQEMHSCVQKACNTAYYDVIIAAGGDGTIVNVAKFMLGTNMPLAILPMGTANVFAQELNIPEMLEKNARMISRGKSREIWPGLLENDDPLNRDEKRLFIQMIGTGPDAYSVQHVDGKIKNSIGRYAYALSGLHALRNYPFEVTIKAKTPNEVVQGSSVVISKGMFYAGRYMIAPFSLQMRPYFHVIVFKEHTPLSWLKRLWKIGTRRIHKCPGIDIFQTNYVTVTSSQQLPVQSDGDYCGYTPFTAKIAPAPLKVIIPSVP